MRKLLNTLYNTKEMRYLALDGLNIVVREDNEEVARVPIHNFEEIVTVGYTGISPALMEACVENNVSICFLKPNDRFIARINGRTRGNVALRKTQYFLSENEDESLKVAKNFIIGKIFNSKWVIERAKRDYTLRLDVDKLANVSNMLSNSIKLAKESVNLNYLRGIEGEAASIYYSVFDDLILQQKESFKFNNRNRRPPMDKVNALLSLTYTMLTNMCTSALEMVGLDPYVGFIHRDRPGRVSMALDLMEELRSVFADRFVLTLINRKIITDRDFEIMENGAVYLSDSGKKKFFTAFQGRKMETITHPFLKEKIEWGIVPYAQALLLARFLRGDLDEYPPFLWK